MILIIIGIVVGISIAIYKTLREIYKPDILDYIYSLFTGSFFGGLSSLIIALFLPMDTYYKKYHYEIELLQDSNSLRGNFFIGSGQIDGKMNYIFYYKEKGFYKLAQIKCDLASVKYVETKPKLIVFEKNPNDSFINKFALDTDISDKTYIIEVPKGTIKNNYNLDGQ